MNKKTGKNSEGRLELSLDFPTWGDYVNFAVNEKTDMNPYAQMSRRVGEIEWAGTETFEEAVKLASDGWTEGEKKTKALSHGLFAHVSHLIERQNVVYDVEGNGIDVAKFLNNEPECWQKFETELTQGSGHRLVRIVFNFSASSKVSSGVIMARGAAIAALVELLEYAGHRVELIAVQSIEYMGKPDTPSSNNYGELRIGVKEFSQNLDMGRVSFALAHPAMLRRIAFSVWERGLDSDQRPKLGIPANYGHPCDLRSDRGDIYIGKALLGEVQWENEKKAERWIINELKKQGVTLSGAVTV